MYKKSYCLNEGDYVFSIQDDFGDGLADCDRYQCGYYKIILDGQKLVDGEGNDFKYEVSHKIKVFERGCEQPTITARGDNAGKGEGKEEAFDGKKNTKWLDFSSTSWIQFQFEGEQKKVINNYKITSGNDFPARDPKDWTLLASNDGTNWDRLDRKKSIVFSQRRQTKEFQISNSKAYKMYKFDFTKNNW